MNRPTSNNTGRAMLLTGAEPAGIAVIRLIGPGVSAFLAEHISRPASDLRCAHGDLHDGPRVIDDAVVVVSGGGAIADLNVHGGAWVIRSVLDLAARHGFDILEASNAPAPIESVDGDTLLEREALAWLPAARTELAIRTLLHQPARWQAWLSAGPHSGRDIAAFLAQPGLHNLLRLPRLAIIGAPNAGKSTLANQLFAQERSITADLPGTTRDWVGEIANVDGLAVMLLDTPGLRQSADALEQSAIDASRSEIAAADLVILVIDASGPIEPEQGSILRAYPDALLVLNKIDAATGGLPAVNAHIQTIARSGGGVQDLRLAIQRRFHCHPAQLSGPLIWTDRQRRILQRAEKEPDAIRLLLEPLS